MSPALSRFDAGAESPFGSDFTLTANTLVSFSAFADVMAATTLGSVGGIGDGAIAFAHLFIEGPGAGNNNFQSLAIEAGIFCGEHVCPPERESGARFLTVSFTNPTDSNMEGFVSRRAGVQGFGSTIPEPETYAMMVAGLGLLGFMLRRRGKLPRA